MRGQNIVFLSKIWKAYITDPRHVEADMKCACSETPLSACRTNTQQSFTKYSPREVTWQDGAIELVQYIIK